MTPRGAARLVPANSVARALAQVGDRWSLLVIAGAAMYAPYGPFFAYIPDILPSNVSGGAIALINSFGALGSFAGAYGVGLLNGATGNPGMSFLLMAAALLASAIIMFFMPERGTAQR